jgi:epsilon-lactone hydrolase
MLSSEMTTVIAGLRARRAARSGHPPPGLEEIRADFALAGGRRPLPPDVAVERVDAGGVPAYWLTTPGATSFRILLFVHGGGYTLGSLASHGALAAELGRHTDRRVLFPEYRLAPEHPFPAAADDVKATWRWLREHHRGDAASILLAGDSAGGGLVLALLHALRDAGEPMPRGAVLISPLVDLTASGPSITERAGEDPIFTPEMMRAVGPAYLAGGDPRAAEASPLFASHAGLPPLLIQVGSAELLLSDSERLAAAALRAGTNVQLDIGEGLPHVYHGAVDTPEAARAFEQIVAFDLGIRAPGRPRAPLD